MCAVKGVHRVWSSPFKPPTSQKAVEHDVLVEWILRELWNKRVHRDEE